MTEITVAVQGIIMFVASSVYGSSNSTDTGAAIAIEASSPAKSAYGLDLPRHAAVLRIRKAAIDTMSPNPCTDRLLPDPDNPQDCKVDLKGDRIQFGEYSNNLCTPFSGSGAMGDITARFPDVPGVPDLTKLELPSTVLLATARPTAQGSYGGISANLVAAWLNISNGELSVRGFDTGDEAEFRPSLHRYQPVHKVEWITEANNPCMIITPFAAGAAAATVHFRANAPVKIDYTNVPQNMGGGHSHARPGTSYDFELLYNILTDKPRIPPVPYTVAPEEPAGLMADSARLKFKQRQMRSMIGCVAQCVDVHKEVNPRTGENCGPGTNPKPGG